MITLRDLQISRSTLIDKPENAARKPTLESLIEEKLILQLAKKKKLKVDKAQVDKKMKELINAYGGYSKFEDYLASVGINTAVVRKKVEDDYLIREALNKYVAYQISISPMDVTEYYNKHIKEFSSPQKCVCWTTKSGKKSFLEELSARIKKEGIDKVLSEEKSIFFKIESNKDDLSDQVKKAVESMKEGQWKIEEIDGSYYLIYLASIVPAYTKFLDEVRDEIYNELWRKEFSEKFEKWINKLREKSVIKIYSTGKAG